MRERSSPDAGCIGGVLVSYQGYLWEETYSTHERRGVECLLLAGGESGVRSALRLLLEQGPGPSVVDGATEAGEVLGQAQAACPDLLLPDWQSVGSARAEEGRSEAGTLREFPAGTTSSPDGGGE